MENIKVEVVKVASKAELTCKLLTDPVGDGIRRSNQEILSEVVKAFGSGSINCVRWYSSKVSKDVFTLKYGLNPEHLNLTPRKDQK